MLLLGICFAIMLNCSVACAEYIYAYTGYQYDSWYGEMRPQYDVYLSTENTPNFLDTYQTILVVPIYVDYQPYRGIQGMSWTAVAYNWNGSRWVCQATDVDADKIWNIVLSYGFFEKAQEDAEREEQERAEKERQKKERERQKRENERQAEMHKKQQEIDAKPYIQQGIELRKKKKFAEAENALNRALEIAPLCVEAYDELAETFFEQKKIQQALNLLNVAIDEKHIEHARLYFQRGITYLLIKDKENRKLNQRLARMDFKKVLELNPDKETKEDAAYYYNALRPGP